MKTILGEIITCIRGIWGVG